MSNEVKLMRTDYNIIHLFIDPPTPTLVLMMVSFRPPYKQTNDELFNEPGDH